MSVLDDALLRHQAFADSYKNGTNDAPKFGTREYFDFRAAIIGLAYLKRIKAVAAENSVDACEEIYKSALCEAKNA